MEERGGKVEGGTTRRTVMRGAAWTVPVVAVAAAAPAFAASPCVNRSPVVSTSTAVTTAPAQGYTRASNTQGSWRTADPDGAATVYTGANIALTSSIVGSVVYGATSSFNNLIAYTTGGVTGVSLNQRPSAAGSARGYANRTETNFNFQRLVYNLTFTIADVSKNGSATGTNAFWDAVWVQSDGTWSVTARDVDVVGGGTSSTDPFVPRDNAPDTGDTDPNNVTLTFSTRCTYVKIYYWSATKATSSNGGQGITISDMSMQLAPDGCV